MNPTLRKISLGAAALFGAAAGVMFVTGHELVLLPALACAVALTASEVARDPRRGAAAAAALGLASSVYLFMQKLDTSDAPSLCNINATFNCDLVNSSAYSEIYGIPVTLFGAAFYLGLLLTAIGKAEKQPRFHQVNSLFAIINVAYCAYLAWASTQLGAFCPLCLTLYAVALLLLWSGVSGAKQAKIGLLDNLSALPVSNAFVNIVAVFLLASLIGNSRWSTVSDDVSASEAKSPSYLETLFHAPRGTVTLSGDEPILGNPDAPYTIVEFADFGCPHCKTAEEQLSELVKANSDVQLRFRPFPLTAECNPALQRKGDIQRCMAAVAAECANEQGKFWQMSHKLFVNQGFFGAEEIRFMAAEIDADTIAFDTCMAAGEAWKRVETSAKAGAEAGIWGTPALFLRGTHGDQYVQVHEPRGVLRLIEAHRDGSPLPPPPAAPTQP